MKNAVLNLIAAAGVSFLVLGSVTAQAASAEVRAKKNIGVNASISNATGVGSGVGLNAFYNVNKRVQFGVGIASSSWDGTEYMELQQEEKYKKETAPASYTTKEATFNASVISVETRVFMGNSFNISGSVGSRSVRGEYVVNSESDATGDRVTTYRSRGLVSNLAIANDWTFDNGMTVGLDWAGISTGMSNSSEVESEDSATTSANLTTARSDVKEFTDGRLDGSTLYIFGLRMGWMF